MADKNIPGNKPSDDREKYRIPSAAEFRDVEYISQANRNKNNKNSTKVESHKSNVKKGSSKRSSSFVGIMLGILYGSAIIALMLILLIVIDSIKVNNNRNNPGTNTVGPFIDETKATYLKINAQSCTLYLGQQINLTVTAYPSDLAYTVTWNSSNEDVVYVDYDGAVIVTGQGVAAVSATSGEYVDAITIEVVAKKGDTTTLGLPLYAQVDDPAFNNTPVTPNQGGYAQEPTQPAQTDEDIDYTGPTYAYNRDNTTADPNNEPETSVPVQTDEDIDAPTKGPDQGGESASKPQNETGHTHTEPASEEEEFTLPTQPVKKVAEIDVTGLTEILISNGFTNHIDNIFVYERDGIYYGEVIAAPTSVQIYIKTRTTMFDAAINSVLSYVLPSTSDIAWSTFTAAKADNTITCEGRKVRFVMAGKNAHTQIIVYNP